MTTPHTVAQSAAAINQVRATCTTDLEISAFLAAIERHHGTEHMVAAHALALELLRYDAVEAADLAAAYAYYHSEDAAVSTADDETFAEYDLRMANEER